VEDSSGADALPYHHILITQFDSLALGRFDPAAVAVLRSAAHSRRLLMLYTVRQLARNFTDATGPLPPVDDAWDLLRRAQSSAPEAVADILADPQLGTWGAHTLRRLRGVQDDDAPLWFHVGQLHALAVVAAIRAGIAGELAVPVRDSDVVLPSLGCLRLPVGLGWGHVAATVESGTVQLRDPNATVELDPNAAEPCADWFPLWSLRSTVDERTLTLRVNDLGPYRSLANPVPPAPASAATLTRWQHMLDEAWPLLVHDHPDRAGELAAAMTALVPLPAAESRFRPESSTVEDGFGSAILSEPHDAAQFAVTLVHEFQHSVLNGVRHLTPLVLASDDDFLGYAPWRDDPRPLGSMIHGIFAFIAVAEFWATQRKRSHGVDADLADFEFALWRRQTRATLDDAQGRPGLTTMGARLLKLIATRLDSLDSLAVPDHIGAAADAAATDHAMGWRACHLTPDRELVRTTVAAWLAGQPVPCELHEAVSVVVPGRKPQRLDGKTALIKMRIADPDLFARLRAENHAVAREVVGASPADVAYVAGDLAAARHLYLGELASGPDRAAAWSGLGLTLAAEGADQPARLLLSRPELARAISAAVAADTGRQPPPIALATWLADGE